VNSPPTLSGTPGTGVTAGTAYSFQPVAADPDGDALSFTISGKPEWAVFSTSTGSLNGTPTSAQTGTYGSIVITVSDGEVTRSIGPFSINVIAQSTGTGSATLSWAPPVQFTDGSALPIGQLAAYKIYHGTSSGALSAIAEVDAASATSHTVQNLGAGTHYFAVTAVTLTGVESAWSEVGSKTIL
jgi:hypothetical protein